ncbi:unnamed protein product [Rangifer tarandus platyrhynchus]|uniref:Uncharacterized protein n=2 Tax=Rangifer tarandus platyrhynchus TaxID=3082113 RepID=A0ABN8XME2_RANTA|nr:unnamed protein product [Rangifer tarandus platyrhynchus]CAI9711219.1 unnamed protein product [Rangifer tarandus platyrhynchus]
MAAPVQPCSGVFPRAPLHAHLCSVSSTCDRGPSSATSVGGQGGRSGIPAGTVSHSFSWAHDSRIYGFQARGHTSGDTVG